MDLVKSLNAFYHTIMIMSIYTIKLWYTPPIFIFTLLSNVVTPNNKLLNPLGHRQHELVTLHITFSWSKIIKQSHRWGTMIVPNHFADCVGAGWSNVGSTYLVAYAVRVGHSH